MALPDALTALKTYMQSQNPEKLTKILDKKKCLMIQCLSFL